MKHHNVPFIIAVAIAAILLLSAQSYINVSTASNNWWLNMTEDQQGFFMLGYITASWTWAQGIYQSSQIEDLSGPTTHIYNRLAPAATCTWPELTAAVTNYYQLPDADLDRPVWQIIHEHATQFKSSQGGL